MAVIQLSRANNDKMQQSWPQGAVRKEECVVNAAGIRRYS